MGRRERLVLLVQEENLELLDQLDKEVNLDLQVLLDEEESQVNEENLDHLGLQDHPGSQAKLDPRDQGERGDQLDLQVQLENVENLVLLDKREVLELQASSS